MDAKLNINYLSSHRGIIKILQMIFGLIFLAFWLLCVGTYSGCFHEGRIGYSSSINAIFFVLNIIFFVLNLLQLSQNQWERIYTLVGLVLFAIAFVLMIWYLIEKRAYYGQSIPATIFIGIQMACFIWDYRIMYGQV